MLNKITKIFYIVFFSSLIFTSLPALSYSPFLDQSYDMYSARGKCEMCHNGSKLNQFGSDFDLQWQQSKDVVKAYLAIEQKDSDNDGFKNIEEIKAGSLPGDKISIPKNNKISKIFPVLENANKKKNFIYMNSTIILNTPDLFRKIKN